ncbi:MAG: chemotaxis protein CheB [Cyanobacteria bacterium P01_F01_bin.150]
MTTLFSEEETQLIPCIVGLGASAGGLRALEEFFEIMPYDSGAAFVVVQHLSPDYKSLMSELLERRTQMPIKVIKNGITLEPNTVYLLPHSHNLVLQGNHLQLVSQKREQYRQPHFPIDIFFSSLAERNKERTISIILSGTGSDGTRGIQQIAEAGGVVLVQDPTTAEFDGMPHSAIATGIVDVISSPRALAETTYQFISSPSYWKTFQESQQPQLRPVQLQQIINVLGDYEDIDFTQYKPGTITRRIKRRCLILGIQDLNSYLHLLQKSATERDALRNDLLINVTRFFRDPEAWTALKEQILPPIIEKCNRQNPFRAWVAACSTGEEAYSMAMILQELRDERLAQDNANAGTDIKPVFDIKIFATDVDPFSLQKASAGVYPQSIANEVSKERLARFFTSNGEKFEVKRSLREMVIFSNHNLAKNAGFTKMNLVSCRNVLIYMQPELQQRVLRSLHFALYKTGVLFLGESENLGDLEQEFNTLHRKWRMYQKLRDVRLPLLTQDLPQLSQRQPIRGYVSSATRPRFDPLIDRAFQLFLEQSQTTTFLIDRHSQLLHLCADPLKLLSIPVGRASQDVMDMLPLSLHLPLSSALHQVRQSKISVKYRGCQIPEKGNSALFRNAQNQGIQQDQNDSQEDHPFIVTLEVTLQAANQDTGEFYLVRLIKETAPKTIPTLTEQVNLDADTAEYVIQLELELRATRENLQSTIEELETTNEEQQATNEELTAANEELQSTNEELQSVNEELYTVNAEYQCKIQELSELNDDLDNLLSNIDIGVIFLDQDLQIRKFTQAAMVAYNLVEVDIGRPIAHLSHSLVDFDMMGAIASVQSAGETIEYEVQSRVNDIDLLLRIHPYQTGKSSIDGVILTFINIDDIKQTQTQLKTAEAELRQTNERLEAQVVERTASLKQSNERYELVLQGSHVGIWDWDIQTGSTIVSERHREMHGVDGESDEPATSHTAFLAAIHPDDQGLFQQAITNHLEQRQPYDIEFQLRHNDGYYIWVRDCGQAVWDEQGNPIRMVGSMEDISDRKAAEAQLQASEARFRTFYNKTPVMMHSINHDGELISVSDFWLRKLGYERHEVLGRKSTDFLTEASQRYAKEVVLPEYFEAEHCTDIPYQMVTKDGRILDVLLSASAESGEFGTFSRSLAVIVDVTELNQVQKALSESDARWQFALEGSGDGVWDWNLKTNHVFFSSQWKTMLGYDDQDIGNTLDEWNSRVHPKDKERCYADIQRHLRQETSIYKNEHRVRCKDGSYKWILGRGKVIDWEPDGKASRMIITHTDIMQQRQTEDLLRNTNEVLEAKVQERTQALAQRAKALEASNADLEEFAYIVSHDLQEPLRAMTAFSQLLDQRHRSQLNESATSYLNHIVEGGVRMQTMIDGILAFARVSYNDPTMEQADTGTILQTVLQVLDVAINENQAVVTHDSLPTIWGNRNQLGQVFQNLIGNSLKFRGLTPPIIHISSEEQPERWVFTIQDNGIGIPSEQKERIFVLFQRLHNREQQDGYGIGLAICKKIIERHRGNIWLESEIGQGTAFHFTIAKELEGNQFKSQHP